MKYFFMGFGFTAPTARGQLLATLLVVSGLFGLSPVVIAASDVPPLPQPGSVEEQRFLQRVPWDWEQYRRQYPLTHWLVRGYRLSAEEAFTLISTQRRDRRLQAVYRLNGWYVAADGYPLESMAQRVRARWGTGSATPILPREQLGEPLPPPSRQQRKAQQARIRALKKEARRDPGPPWVVIAETEAQDKALQIATHYRGLGEYLGIYRNHAGQYVIASTAQARDQGVILGGKAYLTVLLAKGLAPPEARLVAAQYFAETLLEPSALRPLNRDSTGHTLANFVLLVGIALGVKELSETLDIDPMGHAPPGGGGRATPPPREEEATTVGDPRRNAPQDGQMPGWGDDYFGLKPLYPELSPPPELTP